MGCKKRIPFKRVIVTKNDGFKENIFFHNNDKLESELWVNYALKIWEKYDKIFNVCRIWLINKSRELWDIAISEHVVSKILV